MEYMTWIGGCTLVAVCAIYYHYAKSFSYFDKLNIPGPKPRFLFGNLMDTRYAKRHECLIDHVQKYGKVFGLYFGRIPVIHVADPDIAYEVLVKQSDNFLNRLDIVPSPRGAVGLFDAKDLVWKHARESLSPLFSPTKLKEMSQFANEAGKKVLSEVLVVSQDNNVIDVRKLFYSAALETSLASLFGIGLSEEKKNDLEKNFTCFVRGLGKPAAALASSLPTLYSKFLVFFISLGEVIGIVKTMLMLQKIVQSRRQESQHDSSTRTDMLKLLIAAESKDKISDQDAVQHCFNFLIGSYDTTASTLTFVAFALATNPEVQDKLLEEIDQCCPDENDLTYNAMQNLTYMDMVIYEALRYFTPGYIVLREAKKDCTIQGIRFPQGVGVAIVVKAIHADPEIWDNPTKFDPERFTQEAKAKRRPCHYIPFGDGPRKCIGNRLGMINIKLILARLLQRIRFDVAEQTEIPLPTIVLFTAVPENPVYLKVVTRE